MTISGRRGPILTFAAVTTAAVVAFVAITAFLEPIRTAVIGGTGLWTPSPMRIELDELFFGGLTSTGSGAGLVAIVSALAIGLVVTKRPTAAIFVVFAVVGASFITRLLKNVYQAPRPPSVGQAAFMPDAIPGELVVGVVVLAVVIGVLRGWGVRSIGFGAIVLGVLLLEQLTYAVPVDPGFDSFPSGHALNSATLATAIILLTWRDHRWRWPIVAVAASYALGVGLSRLYLGVHYPVDVIGGWCFGIAWTLAVWLELRTSKMWRRERLSPFGGVHGGDVRRPASKTGPPRMDERPAARR